MFINFEKDKFVKPLSGAFIITFNYTLAEWTEIENADVCNTDEFET